MSKTKCSENEFFDHIYFPIFKENKATTPAIDYLNSRFEEVKRLYINEEGDCLDELEKDFSDLKEAYSGDNEAKLKRPFNEYGIG